jgi:hypothetical protein
MRMFGIFLLGVSGLFLISKLIYQIHVALKIKIKLSKMPTLTEYIKTISTAFLNGSVNSSILTTEISASSISISLERIDTAGDVCSIWFKDALSGGEVTVLDSIVALHDGSAHIDHVQEVRIAEESTATGGHFGCSSVQVTAGASATGETILSWPFPMSALLMTYIATDTQVGDKVSVTVGENGIIGAITASISSLPTGHTSQNYTAGDKVTYTDPVNNANGPRVYTCIYNTVSNEIPTNKSFWRHGFEVKVNATVLTYTSIGYYIKLWDGVNTSDMGRVLYKSSNSIFCENPPATTFSAATPTYVKQTVYVVKDYILGAIGRNIIGEGKLGGSYVPSDVKVRVQYTNTHGVENTFTASYEYLY